MSTHISQVDYKILELLYHYGFAWCADLRRFLGVSQSFTNRRLVRLVEMQFLNERKLGGERRTKTYGLTESGLQFMKARFGYHAQYIVDRDYRLNTLTDGFIRHECLITHIASRFSAEHIYDRRSFLSYLPEMAQRARNDDAILRMEIRSIAKGASHRADDILYIKGKRPTVLFIEVDRGTESARDKHGRPRGKVSKMFDFYIDAYREKYYRRYFGKEIKPYVLFLISTPWNGATRKKNFVDLWKEVGQGSAESLPIFTTLEAFNQSDPLNLLGI